MEVALVLGRDRPEFEAWLSAWRSRASQVFAPWWRGREAGGAQAAHRPIWPTLRRSLRLRTLGVTGGVRQAALEAFDRDQAGAVAARLRPTVRHLVIGQELLPFLHASGALGGRTYDVLLHRPHRALLHGMLDEARVREPAFASLADFRSPPDVVAAEEAALRGARHVITANLHLARLFPGRAIVVPQPRWEARPSVAGGRVGFLGPTLARRGAGLVRSMMREVGQALVVIGNNLEEPDFWRGMSVEGRPAGPAQFDGVGLLLAPAITDTDPRRLHQALCQGITVVAPPICGLGPGPNLHLVDPFDRDTMIDIINTFISKKVSLA